MSAKPHYISFRVSDEELAEIDRQVESLRSMPRFEPSIAANVTRSDGLRSLLSRKESNTPPLPSIDMHSLSAEVNAALWALEAAGQTKFDGDARVLVLEALTAAQDFARERQRVGLGIGENQDIVPGRG